MEEVDYGNMEDSMFLRLLVQLALSSRNCDCGCRDLCEVRERQRAEADRKLSEEARARIEAENQKRLNGDIE
jgi:hypothetical protein